MSNIFISYRRDDSAAWAGRLCDQFNRLAGADHVFMDVEDIPPGDRFATTIDKKMASCEIALIVIGPKWADILRERAKLPQPDYVAHEIAAALARPIKVVPVLVGGARVSDLDNLPGGLAGLSQYEVAELRDGTFAEDCERLAKKLGLKSEPGPVGLKVAIALAVLLALGIAGWMAYESWSERRAREAAASQVFATAKSQSDRGEYESAFRTYQNILKTDPQNSRAIDLQLDAAMGWLENFHVLVPEGGKAEQLAGPQLDEILPVMDAALARSGGKGSRAADILAHTGWWHWLNQKIALREFGQSAERDMRKALEIDPSNVYAHAMLGNWLMQTGGKTSEALAHFRLASETGKARAYVHELQLGVLTYPRDSVTRTALIRVANEMRQGGEPLDPRLRSRILSAFSPTVNTLEEITEALKAVPPADARATYDWLDSGRTEDYQRAQRDFVHASILEIEGKRDEALAAFQSLRTEMKRLGYNGRIATYVDSAVQRLSKP